MINEEMFWVIFFTFLIVITIMFLVKLNKNKEAYKKEMRKKEEDKKEEDRKEAYKERMRIREQRGNFKSSYASNKDLKPSSRTSYVKTNDDDNTDVVIAAVAYVCSESSSSDSSSSSSCD